MISRRQRPAMDCCPFSSKPKYFQDIFHTPLIFALWDLPIIEGQALNKNIGGFVYGEISSCH